MLESPCWSPRAGVPVLESPISNYGLRMTLHPPQKMPASSSCLEKFLILYKKLTSQKSECKPKKKKKHKFVENCCHRQKGSNRQAKMVL